MKSLNTDAFAPSIEVIGKQTMAPDEHLDVFNPFFRFESSMPLTELRYSFCLLREENPQEHERNLHRLPDDCDFRQQITIVPRTYEDKTSLILPLRGKIFIWEGHDFFSHHLRVPLADTDVQQRGITANSNEPATSSTLTRRDEPIMTTPESWRTGTVTASPSTPERESFSPQPTTSRTTGSKTRRQRQLDIPRFQQVKDPKDIGNFALIDHENGEYSLLVHMKPGSVLVRSGDRVKHGQKVGAIGFAGDSIFPHLHYSLMNGPELFKAWGLPTYFLHFHRLGGANSIPVQQDSINSGTS